jgi:hypothetical protein
VWDAVTPGIQGDLESEALAEDFRLTKEYYCTQATGIQRVRKVRQAENIHSGYLTAMENGPFIDDFPIKTSI